MGKTQRNSTSSRSDWIKGNKTRGLIRKLDRNSHHSLRNENRNADELTFSTSISKHHQVWKPGFRKSNVFNFGNGGRIKNYSLLINDIIIGHDNWNDYDDYDNIKRNGLSLKDNIKSYLEKKTINNNDRDLLHLKNSLKQLLRRGKLHEYIGRKNERNDKLISQNYFN